MYLTVKQQIKQLSKEDYENLKSLSHYAKNLANEALYNIRQYYFQEKKYLSYEECYNLLKSSSNYKTLNSNMAQQILKKVDEQFKSFFGLLKLAKRGEYSYQDIKLPHYLPKDGFSLLIIQDIRIRDNKLKIPYSIKYSKEHKSIIINIPPILVGKKIKEIRIIPRCSARFFEIQYTYEVEEDIKKLDETKALAIDLGVNNFATCVTNEGKTFILDGRKIKSINQWYNKRNAYLQSIKDKQKNKMNTKLQDKIRLKRKNRINDIISKYARYVINYCIQNEIKNIVCGVNKLFQKNSNIGRINNQNFVNLPYEQFRNKLKYLCELNGINFIEQEESYTSKASFWDKDCIPIYNANSNQEYNFSGSRIHRGLYKTKKGKILNADVNGALNILRKSNVVSLEGLYSRGELNTPVRIRIA